MKGISIHRTGAAGGAVRAAFRIALGMVLAAGLLSALPAVAGDDGVTFRRSNFSNEFELTTPEGINARGVALVASGPQGHHVRIRANGLTPGAAYVIINHWFEPIPARGVGTSDPSEDPSCNGHFQFLGGVPLIADEKGRLRVNTQVEQLAPHVWVVDFAKFLEVTGNGTHAPSSPDAFVTGGLLVPFADLLDEEDDFVDTDPLTDCS